MRQRTVKLMRRLAKAMGVSQRDASANLKKQFGGSHREKGRLTAAMKHGITISILEAIDVT